jgi:hypothetical protein
MTPELAYFLKINIAIALFYAFYRLFFYRDTFFQWRRTVLLCFLVISPLYPVLNIQEWIRSHEPMVAMVDLYATIVLPEIEITPEVRAADWQSIILSTVNIIYWSGVTLLLVRFFAQLASILRLRLRCRKDQIEGIPVYLLDKESGPFSFFHYFQVRECTVCLNYELCDDLALCSVFLGDHRITKMAVDEMIHIPYATRKLRHFLHNLEYDLLPAFFLGGLFGYAALLRL